jgi:hypothetical protein
LFGLLIAFNYALSTQHFSLDAPVGWVDVRKPNKLGVRSKQLTSQRFCIKREKRA